VSEGIIACISESKYYSVELQKSFGSAASVDRGAGLAVALYVLSGLSSLKTDGVPMHVHCELRKPLIN
jgi:hypothetical protein